MAQPPPNKTPSKHTAPPKGTPVSSQRYLDVAQVRDGVVVMRDGSMRAIILVNAVNFALKSEEEQNALVYSYQGFLNSFNFPIQIVMQSRQLDLANYIQKLQDRLSETTNELIHMQINDYSSFIDRLISIANIMDKKFYVVVPFTPSVAYQRGMVDKLFNPTNRLEVKMSPGEFKSYRQELLERAKIIMGGLSGVGVRTALLGTQEVIELLYASYNPEEATKQRLTNFENVTGSYVHPGADDTAVQKPVAAETPQEAAAQNPLAHIAPEATPTPTEPTPEEAPVAPAPEPALAPEPVEAPVTAEPSVPQAPTEPTPAPAAAPAPEPSFFMPTTESVPATPAEPAAPVTPPAPEDAAPTPKPEVKPTDALSLPTTLPETAGVTNEKPVVAASAPAAVPTASGQAAPVAPPKPSFGTPAPVQSTPNPLPTAPNTPKVL